MAAPEKLVCFSQIPEEETHCARQGSTGRLQGGQEAEGAGQWGRSLGKHRRGREPGSGLASWKNFSGLRVQGLSLVVGSWPWGDHGQGTVECEEVKEVVGVGWLVCI